MLRVFLTIDDYNELIYLQTLLKKIGFDVEGLQNTKKYADVSLGFNPQILIATAHGKKVDGLALARGIHKRRGLPKIIALKSSHQMISDRDFEDAGVDTVLESPINIKKLLEALAHLGGVDEAALFEKYSKIKGLLPDPGDAGQTVLSFDDNGQPVEELQKVRSAIESVVEQKGSEKSYTFSLDEQKTTVSGDKKQPTFALDTKPLSAGPEDVTEEDSYGSEHNPEDPVRQERFDKCLTNMGPLPEQHFERERILNFNKMIRSSPPPDDIDKIEDERKRFVRSLFKGKK